jgi:hypothetical protein
MGQGATVWLNGLSLPPANPRRGFKLMKSAQPSGIVKHDARDANGGRERHFGGKSRQNA